MTTTPLTALAATPPALPATKAVHSTQTLPTALRPALYQALAKDAGLSYAIGKDGCADLPKQPLRACFTPAGVRFAGAGTPLALRLAAWGRGAAMRAVGATKPTITGNRTSYVHEGVTEWWRVLPMSFEQGFTIAKRPAGHGELTLALVASGIARTRKRTLAFGKLRYGHLVVTDARGKVVPSTLRSKGADILIAVNDTAAAYPLTVDPLVWVQQQKVVASDGAAYDLFGTSVALSGTTALVGAPFNGAQGAAYVFDDSGGTWTQTQKLTASDGAAGDEFGYSVALDGTTALVGSPYATIGGNSQQGAAYVFTESGGTWTQTVKLIASDGASFDYFGWSVALDGTTGLVGAYGATVGGNSYQGAAYVFTESGGVWTQAQKLTASDGAAYDSFGFSVALGGTTALVGAAGATSAQGAAYVFDESGGAWSQTQKLTASDGAAGDQFGSSVALDGASAIVGAFERMADGNGAAYVFDDSGGTWTQTQKLIASDGAAGDGFGTSVAIAGTTALVGSPYATVGGNGSQGAAYAFDQSGGTWTQTQELTASDGAANNLFGASVALDGITALVGALSATVGGNVYQGAAYTYTAACPQGYGEHDGTLAAGRLYATPSYQAPAGLENAILGGPAGFRLYALYSNGTSQHLYQIPGNEIHKQAPAGTYRWGVKAGSTGGNYTLCVLHP